MIRICFLIILLSPAFAQQPVARVNSGNIDFGSATTTSPAKRGTTLPATCAVGEEYFKTDAVAGQNKYGCTATNTWTVLGDGGAGGGEANTASNVGTVGVGLFKQKTALDLEFYKVNSVNTLATWALNGTDRIDLTINESNFTLTNIGGTLSVGKGGTGLTTVTTNALVKGNGTGALAVSGVTIDASNNISTPGNVTSGSGVATGGSAVLGNAAGDTAASFIEANSGDAASNAEPGYLKLWSSHTTKRQASLFPCTDAVGFFCISGATPAADSTDIIATAANTVTFTNKSANASILTAGTVATARLGSGTADGTTFLRGDQTWAAPPGITASSTDTLTNKTIDAEGTGNVITSPLFLSFPAANCQGVTAFSGFAFPVSNPPTAACVAGTNTIYGVLQFPDSDGDYSTQTSFRLASDWSGTIDIDFFWRTSETTGDVVWQFQTAFAADGETGDPSYNTAQSITDTAKGTANQWNNATLNGVTLTGGSPGEQMFLRVFRNRTHASDTLVGVPELITVRLKLRRTM
jgi:hypothetical protein